MTCDCRSCHGQQCERRGNLLLSYLRRALSEMRRKACFYWKKKKKCTLLEDFFLTRPHELFDNHILDMEKARPAGRPPKVLKGSKMPATRVKQKRMQVAEIKDKARGLGINPGKMKKAELIHSIQIAEGCSPCFGRSDGHCGYTDCCFMPDCLKTR